MFYKKGLDLIPYQQPHTAHFGTSKNVKQFDGTKT